MEPTSENFLHEGSRRTTVAFACAVWFVLGGIVLVVRVVSLVRHKSASCSVGRCLVHVVRFCRRSVSLIFSTDSGSVAEELQKMRLVRAHSWLMYGVLVASLVVLTASARAISPAPRFNSSVQDVSMMVGCFVVLFLVACPRVVTLSTLNVWSSTVAVCITMYGSPFAIEASYAASSAPICFTSMMVLCLFNLNVRLNAFWLLVLTATLCSSILCGTVEPLTACDFEARRVHYSVQICMAGLMLTACVICVHKYICLAAQHEMEARISRNGLQAARSVLRGVCDAVVELNSEFCLQDESPQLVDMLLLNSQRSLLGKDVRSFLASEQDRQKFTEQMGRSWDQSDDEVGLSAAFHVSMKDSSSVPLVVEVFSVLFVNRDAQAAYFVGIREFTDISPILTLGSAAQVRSCVRHRAAAPEAVSWAPAAPALDSTQDSSDGSSEFLIECEAIGWIDILTADYTVRHASPAFAKHLEANSEFLPALKPRARAGFTRWIQQAWFDLLEEAPDSGGKLYSERLHIRCSARAATSGTRRTRRLLSAYVRIDLTPPPGGQPHGKGVVRIVLQDLQIDTRAPRILSKGTPPATPRASLERGPPGRVQRPEAEEAAAEGQRPAEATAGAAEGRRGGAAGAASQPQGCAEAATAAAEVRARAAAGRAASPQRTLQL
ncbi:unnamed protein product [Prorocentrum cordatum]|uniref:Uncharacterized protein n=1 Tax=Prorocentrum cordatum TaxID=2364126 RepID=A0ABN9V5L1_9DINO|nr:unnamed protein product [Polarella glacialis]